MKRAVYTKGSNKSLFTLFYDDAMKHSQSFRDFIDKYPDIAEPIEVLFKQNKALGRHAGGVIVAEDIPAAHAIDYGSWRSADSMGGRDAL